MIWCGLSRAIKRERQKCAISDEFDEINDKFSYPYIESCAFSLSSCLLYIHILTYILDTILCNIHIYTIISIYNIIYT